MARIIRIACFVLCALLSLNSGCPEEETTDYTKNVPAVKYIYPPENAVGMSRTPTFIWKNYEREGAYYYKWILSQEDGYTAFTSRITYDTLISCPDTLDEGTVYRWYVQAISGDFEKSGDYWYFTTGTGFNNPPLVPFNPVPGDPGTSIPLYQVLGWDCIDPDGDDLTYDVWLGTYLGGNDVLIADGVSEKTADPGGLEPETTYQWKVVAFDAHGDSTVGPWWKFKTIPASNKPPIEPWGPSPADDATNMPLDVTLSWNCEDPEDDPITYTVSIGHAGGTLIIVGSDLTDTSFEVTGLDPFTEYEWLVKATDDHSNVKPGPIWSFTTGDGTPVREVFAALTLGRSITYDGTVRRNDYIFARFDSVYAPNGPINPLQPAAVSCNTFDLIWTTGTKQYAYTDYVAGYFLNPGATYIFTVTEGDGVPALTTDPIVFPSCQPYITSPEPFSFVSMNGFDLEWHTFCSGMIDITIMDLNADSTGVYIRTEDDGFYTFTADDLAPISASAYQLQIVLINENRKTIAAQGYDPRSWLWARTLSTQIVYVQRP